MRRLIVSESPPLHGAVKISGSKNSVLPILAATLLTEEKCVIHDVPPLTDVLVMEEILKMLGAGVKKDKRAGSLSVTAAGITMCEADYELVRSMRASFLIMGPLLSRLGIVRVAMPGGCAIGARPVDLHLKGFAALGAEISVNNGFVEAKADKLHGANIYLDFPSVGATENIIMAAVTAKGQTVLQNCATEPEIVDLANFLTSIGAEIKGSGTDTIKINGVESLKGAEYTIIPDRIEAGTFMAAAAATCGKIRLENILADHLRPVIAKLNEAGVVTIEDESSLLVDASNGIRPIDVKTMPYPGFPTDMQAQFMGFLSQAKGTSIIIETIFENRFMHVGELKRMGADIKIEGRSAVIDGKTKLMGAPVKATDLRAGAALIIAALNARGDTEISEISHIERGYDKIYKKLKKLGARIELIEE